MEDTDIIDIKAHIQDMGCRARQASLETSRASTAVKNLALTYIAQAIAEDSDTILQKNALDLEKARANQLDSALLDRLELNAARINGMIEGLHQVAALPDPCGQITDLSYRPSGIQVGKQRAPLGVIGIIYESRPNVTVDAASLCLKSGNATILRGGSEAFHSNQAIAACIHRGLKRAGVSADAVQVIDITDRAAVGELITLSDYVDVIVPRGGKSLIERIARESTVSVIKHLDGICHVYIDDQADAKKAFDIALNSKTHRYGVCNAMETLLVAEGIARDILPGLAEAYVAKGVELRVCAAGQKILPDATIASADDWDTEYLAPILAIKIVADMKEAIEHIHAHSSQHTDAIVTENYTRARCFMSQVDSSSVIVNASTRFADGFEYGLGAEIGISTDKIHVRGPVGLEGLTSQKWVVFGDGHIRS